MSIARPALESVSDPARAGGPVPRRVRVVIADDHPVYRDGIIRALLETGRYEIAGEAEDGRAAAQVIARRRPDVALLDLRMPDLDGLGALRWLRRHGIETPIVFLTAFPHPELVCQALEAGAAGCLSKGAARGEIVAALDAVAVGGRIAQTAAAGDGRPALMEVELRLLSLLHAGWSVHELPAVARLPRSRVERYLADAIGKLAAEDVGDAVASAAAWGLIPKGRHT